MSFTTSHRNRNRRNEDSSIYKHSIISYNERSDCSYIPKNKTDFVAILSLMLSYYLQEKQRSFTSGDFWVLPRLPRWRVTHFQFSLDLPRWRPCQIPDPGARHAQMSKSLPRGKLTLNQFPVGSPPPPSHPQPTLGLNIDRCIRTIL